MPLPMIHFVFDAIHNLLHEPEVSILPDGPTGGGSSSKELPLIGGVHSLNTDAAEQPKGEFGSPSSQAVPSRKVVPELFTRSLGVITEEFVSDDSFLP